MYILLYFLFGVKKQGVVKPPSSASINEHLSKIKAFSNDAPRLLISRDGIGWKVKLRIRSNDDLIWAQSNIANVNEMDYSRWNEWDGLETEGNEMKHETMKCGLKEVRWNMNNEVNKVTPFSLSSTTLQTDQK